MNTYRILYDTKKVTMFPIVIRYEASYKESAQIVAMHLKDSMSQLGIIPQTGVRTTVNLEFRNGKKVRHFNV